MKTRIIMYAAPGHETTVFSMTSAPVILGQVHEKKSPLVLTDGCAELEFEDSFSAVFVDGPGVIEIVGSEPVDVAKFSRHKHPDGSVYYGGSGWQRSASVERIEVPPNGGIDRVVLRQPPVAA